MGDSGIGAKNSVDRNDWFDASYFTTKSATKSAPSHNGVPFKLKEQAGTRFGMQAVTVWGWKGRSDCGLLNAFSRRNMQMSLLL